jgi:hypothetical protein
VAILHQPLGLLSNDVVELRAPIDLRAFAGGGAQDGLGDALLPALPARRVEKVPAADERVRGGDEAVYGVEIAAAPAVEVLLPIAATMNLRPAQARFQIAGDAAEQLGPELIAVAAVQERCRQQRSWRTSHQLQRRMPDAALERGHQAVAQRQAWPFTPGHQVDRQIPAQIGSMLGAPLAAQPGAIAFAQCVEIDRVESLCFDGGVGPQVAQRPMRTPVVPRYSEVNGCAGSSPGSRSLGCGGQPSGCVASCRAAAAAIQTIASRARCASHGAAFSGSWRAGSKSMAVPLQSSRDGRRTPGAHAERTGRSAGLGRA